MYENRIEKLQTLLVQKRLQALFVTSPQNVAYLSGLRGTYSPDVLVPCLTDPEYTLLIIASGTHLPHRMARYVLADARHPTKSPIQKNPRPWEKMLQRIVVKRSIFQTLEELCKKHRIKKLGVEEEALSAADLHRLKKTLTGADTVNASRMVPDLRVAKDADEIAALTKACHITDRAFAALLRFVRPGMTEGAVAHFLVDFFHRHADGSSFAPIVASGMGAAVPHYCTSKTKKIRRGEMLLLDFGARIHGYHADMSRTIFIGKATPRFKKIYNLVREAQEKTIAALHAGMEGRAADAVARKILTDAGYKKEFAHGTGHGVGLQIHEAPRLSPLSKDILHAENVFTVEPGLYFPEWGGVRIEDTVLLTQKGPRVLTRSSKELIETRS